MLNSNVPRTNVSIGARIDLFDVDRIEGLLPGVQGFFRVTMVRKSR